jgi:hypothetical protein
MVHSSRKTYKDRAQRQEEAISHSKNEEKGGYVDLVFSLARSAECIEKTDNATYSAVTDAVHLSSAVDALSGVLGVTFDPVGSNIDKDIEDQPVIERITRLREIIQATNDILWAIVDAWDDESAHRRAIGEAQELAAKTLHKLKKARREAFVIGTGVTKEAMYRMDQDALEKDRYSPQSALAIRKKYIQEKVVVLDAEGQEEIQE